MWFFAKKGDMESKIEKLDYALENSFQRVKDDMANLNTWINYLYSQDTQRQRLIDIIHGQMNQIVSRPQQDVSVNLQPIHDKLRQVEDKIETVGVTVRAIEPVIDKVAQLNSHLRDVEENQKSVFERLREISEKVEKQGTFRMKNSFNLKEKIIKKVAQHSKDYIKNLILSTVAKYEQISALQMREMIVEEQGLCSKSTFYRLLEEIEAENSVDMVAQGKEKMYFPKLAKQHNV